MTTILTPQRLRIIITWHRPLLVMVAAMLGLALVSSTGMLFDDRMLLGESVWVKPLKFAVAFALYGATLAWLLTLPHRGRRWTFWLGSAFAVTGIVDVGFIAIQAARGTFSHFSTAADTVNSVGQMIFASGVPGLFFANLAIAGILVWQRTADRPLTMAIRAGLVFAVAGMALGYVMAAQGKQVVRDASGRDVELAARHTVGAMDGGPGLPITHWSTVGGDLRIPHFVGLHGLQVMLLVALAVAAAGGRIALVAHRAVPGGTYRRIGLRLRRVACHRDVAGPARPGLDSSRRDHIGSNGCACDGDRIRCVDSTGGGNARLAQPLRLACQVHEFLAQRRQLGLGGTLVDRRCHVFGCAAGRKGSVS